MSAKAIDLNGRGWHPRPATERDVPAGVKWEGLVVYERHDGLKTPAMAHAEAARMAALKMEEAGVGTPEGAEEVAPAAMPELPEDLKAAGWRIFRDRGEDGTSDQWLFYCAKGVKGHGQKRTNRWPEPDVVIKAARKIQETEDRHAAARRPPAEVAAATEEDEATRNVLESAVHDPEAAEEVAVTVEAATPARPAPAAGTLFGEDPAALPPPLTQQMHPSRVSTHPSTLMRAGGLDREHVEDLRAVLRGRGSLPPVDVYFDGERHWLADGNHRHQAAHLEDALLDVVVHKGTLRDAILHAVRANAHHGLKRTNDDKRLAVVTLLADPEWSARSDTSIAELADVTQPFVGKVQGWLEKLRPLLAGDAEEISNSTDEELAEQSGVPEGLIAIVRGLDPGVRAALTHNVMSRAESRRGRDGRQYSVEKPPAEAVAPLFEDGQIEDDTRRTATLDMNDPTGELEVAVLEEEQAAREFDPVDEANNEAARLEERATNAANAEPEDAGVEKIVVTDRRRFAEELSPAAARAETSGPPAQGAAAAMTQSTPAAASSPEEKKVDRWAEVEKRLNGRALAVTHTLMPKGMGVMITVNLAGAEPSDATNSRLFPVEKVMRLGAEEFEVITRRLEAEKQKPKSASKSAQKSVPAKPAAKFKLGDTVRVTDKADRNFGMRGEVKGTYTDDHWKFKVKIGVKYYDYRASQLAPEKKTATRGATKKAAAGKAWDKSPLNPANFAKGSEVRLQVDGRAAAGKVVGVSPGDERQLRVRVGSKKIDTFPSQLLPAKAGAKKGKG